MQNYLGALTMLLLIIMVIARSAILRRQGVQAMHFGKLDRSDFLIPPFAFFYIYLIFAAAFHWPVPGNPLVPPSMAGWLGVLLCAVGLVLMLWSLVSFGRSFRVGIDPEKPGGLITTGAFAVSRNPIYVAFAFVLLGQFLIFPHLILLLYTLVGFWLFHRQVLREEEFLRVHYGLQYADYCRRVRRYL